MDAWDAADLEPETTAYYGVPVSSDIAEDILLSREGSETNGLLWEAYILGDECKNPNFVIKGSMEVKLRRPIPVVRRNDFFRSLIQTNKKGLWVFSGMLNGWPALNLLELISLENFGTKKKQKNADFELWAVDKDERETTLVWHRDSDGDKKPTYTAASTDYIKATLRSPPFTSLGYTRHNPGSIWYFAQFRSFPNKVAHGMNIVRAIEQEYNGNMPRARKCYHVVHRYPRKNPETDFEKLIYHSAVFIEWDHGKHGTLVELAYKYGIGGYDGKSSWIDDAVVPELYKCLPAMIKAPWKDFLAEIRIIDTHYANGEELKDYMMEFNEKNPHSVKYIDPTIYMAADMRKSNFTLRELAESCLRYVLTDTRYNSRLAEDQRSCQTFSTDLFQFLSKNYTASPFSEILHPIYRSRALDFTRKR